MLSHVRVLGILHIVLAVVVICGGLIGFLIFGSIAGVVGATDRSGDAFVAIPIIGGIGAFVLAIALALALPGLLAGIGLLSYRNWARILTIVLSALHILNFPFGTALGVYGFWVLLSPEVAAAFQTRQLAAS